MKIEFIKKYRKWNVGDTEEFKDKKAEYLIKLGWAKKYETKQHPKTKKGATEKKK